ncbi:MAG: hypothetical protein HPY50_00370 [Firmicutes bacterium]|nr:hypothetical protein [Bacillota bacterium]
MAIATAFMARATFSLGTQTKRSVEEPKRTEIERAFLRVFGSLRKDILKFDDLYFRFSYGNLRVTDMSQTEKIKETLNLFRNIEFSSFDKIENLLEVLLFPVELLKRIWAVESLIRSDLSSIGFISDNTTSFSSELTNQTIPNYLLSVRLYQRQLACYLIKEADNQGLRDMAITMAEVKEFKPDNSLQRCGIFLPEQNMPDEPEGCYSCCKLENLIAQAKEAGKHMDVFGLTIDMNLPR